MRSLAVALAALVGGAALAGQSPAPQPVQAPQSPMAAVLKHMAGHEDEPAEKVFANIELLKGRPASRLPGMMTALTGLLGVECSFCHDLNNFGTDTPRKITARKHFAMQAALNRDQFAGANAVSCWTCHRGTPKPEIQAGAPTQSAPSQSGAQSAGSTQSTQSAGSTQSTQSAASTQPTPTNNDEMVRRIRASIAGREQEPAGQVFKNVQFLRNTRAGTFLSIMNGGYSKALGVACSHCHDENDFASDAKRPKRAAREVQTLHRAFNDGLREMKEADSPSDDRAISCITCHRGAVKPFRG